MNKNIDFYWPNIIKGIVMAIIATIMCIVFARTKATGDSNLIWILVVAAINVVVIGITIYGFDNFVGFDYDGTVIKQLALSIPYVILLFCQMHLIDNGTIPKACFHFWWEFSIGVAICIFNLVIVRIEYLDIGFVPEDIAYAYLAAFIYLVIIMFAFELVKL